MSPCRDERPVPPELDLVRRRSKSEGGMLFDIHIRTTRAAYGLVKLSIMAADFSIVSLFAGELPGTSWRSSPGSSKSWVALHSMPGHLARPEPRAIERIGVLRARPCRDHVAYAEAAVSGGFALCETGEAAIVLAVAGQAIGGLAEARGCSSGRGRDEGTDGKDKSGGSEASHIAES